MNGFSSAALFFDNQVKAVHCSDSFIAQRVVNIVERIGIKRCRREAAGLLFYLQPAHGLFHSDSAVTGPMKGRLSDKQQTRQTYIV